MDTIGFYPMHLFYDVEGNITPEMLPYLGDYIQAVVDIKMRDWGF